MPSMMEAIDKKIEAESLAGIRSAQSFQPLRSSVANIVNSFRNNKNFDENYDLKHLLKNAMPI